MVSNTQKKATRHRAKGTGGIVDTGKKKDGLPLFRLRVFVGTDRTGLKPQPIVRQRTVRAKNITEAQQLYKDYEREVRASSPSVPGVRTVNDLLTEWAKRQRAQGRSARTVYDTERTRDRVLGPLIGHIDVQKLTAHDVDQAWAALISGEAEGHAPQSPTSIRRYRSVLSGAYEMALDYAWAQANPVPRAKGIPPQRKRQLRVAEAQGVRRLLVEAEKRNDKHAMLLRLSVGLCTRAGETCAIRWSHRGEDAEGHPVLTVGRALYRAGKQRGEKDTKTHRTWTVPINKALVESLRSWRSVCEARAAEAGVTLVPDAFVVSPFSDGSRPVSPDAFSSFVHGLARDLGVDLGNGRNPFRHFGGSTLSAKGVSPADGAAILGHSRVSTFTDNYLAATPERSRAAAEILGGTLAAGDGEGLEEEAAEG
jgi:integrase